MATELERDAGAGGALSELDEFSAILKQNFKPRSDVAAKEVENAVATLVREALSDDSVISEDILDTIDKMMAKLDEKLTAQVNEIIHHPEYQKLESSWRGLAYTVNNTESDASLKVLVMNVGKSELDRELRAYPGGVSQTRIIHNEGTAIAHMMRLKVGETVLSFISTTTVFGTPLDVTLSELAIESFFPVDETTRRALQG